MFVYSLHMPTSFLYSVLSWYLLPYEINYPSFSYLCRRRSQDYFWCRSRWGFVVHIICFMTVNKIAYCTSNQLSCSVILILHSKVTTLCQHWCLIGKTMSICYWCSWNCIFIPSTMPLSSCYSFTVSVRSHPCFEGVIYATCTCSHW